jgi:hypothetical protein
MVFKDGLYPIFSEALTLLKLSVIPLGALVGVSPMEIAMQS